MNHLTINGYPLDEEQLKPILEDEKYSLIIAGAGSGKTLTLIGKIKYLLETKKCQKEEICCISFTNEAANNLSRNIEKNCHQKVNTFTFHKLALEILKDKNYQIANPKLLDETIDEFFYSKCFGNKFLQNIIYKSFYIYFFKNEKNWQKIITSKECLKYKKTIQTFINLMKGKGYSKTKLKDYLAKKKYRNMLIVIYAIYTIYEEEKQSQNIVDFDDIILNAILKLKEKKVSLPYKYIIIDEFQDTSLCRFKLINELVKLNDASLCVVGDDYQSIYHFSGCDLYLFLHFKDFYPSAKIYKLETTYRNSQELVDIAGNFIQKNPIQVKKILKSKKHLSKPIIIAYYRNSATVLKKIIEKIPKEKEILIIGRNNFDLQKYTKYLSFEKDNENYLKFNFTSHKIRYLTIHSSKGLESDVVILLNVIDDTYGLPSKMKDEKILSLIKERETYLYEEERRLFYVALTRTKSYIYLLTTKKYPSPFIKEIEQEKNIQIMNI